VKTESPHDDRELRGRLQRVNELLLEAEGHADSVARARIGEIVQALMEFHGAGLERMLGQIASTGDAGQQLIDSLARDELVASLLLLYGLHPLDLETRVREALEKVRPYLHSHGGNVELLGVDEAVVRLRLQGSCHGCPSSSMTLKQTIEEAIHEKAPDVMGIEVEGETIQPPIAAEANRVALPILAG
jgi:Fe-S cluster biogenesis protein NfuA